MDGGFGVAGDTFCWRAFEDLIYVAGSAGLCGVTAVQREDLGVIKISHAPCTVVTIGAGQAKLGGVFGHEVRIAFLVTIHTANSGDDGRFRFIPRVAGLAGKRVTVKLGHVPGKAKAGCLGMFEGRLLPVGGQPGFCRVAGGALCAEKSGVLPRLRVAGDTFLGGPSKLAGVVAVFTGGLQMFSGQEKFFVVCFDGKFGHAVLPIVADEAVGAVSLNVAFHKGRGFAAVAVGADGRVHRELVGLFVAVCTGDSSFAVI